MNGSICQIVYVSSAVRELSELELAEILVQARIQNAAASITGMLLYAGGNFMQVLEGPRVDVAQTFARIRRDPRHRGLIVLLDVQVQDRYFPEWSMGFECIHGEDEMIEIPGYADLRDLSQKDLESAAHKLLKTFMRHMAGIA